MVAWYSKALDMKSGPRPPFSFPGAWLYAGKDAVLHLVGVDQEQRSIEPKLEHFALSATGLDGFLEQLKASGTEYTASRVPGFGMLQVHLSDVDGNHIHIDFSPEEADAAGL